MAKAGDIWVSNCGLMELRCGRWEDVLADVTECDAVITDPPYSERTHKGNENLPDHRSDLSGYTWLDAETARAWCLAFNEMSNGWTVIFCDDDLSQIYKAAHAEAGRYEFAAVPVIQHRVRMTGDGPGSCAVYLMVSRPKQKRFLSWGALPGWYKSTPEKSFVNGAKRIELMRQIVCDYSMPGDLIVDPCAGGFTTILAAAIEGRRAIGAEKDPKTFELAVKRLSKGYTPRMNLPPLPKPKQETLL